MRHPGPQTAFEEIGARGALCSTAFTPTGLFCPASDRQIRNTGSHHSVICGRAGVGELHTLQPSADSHTAACCTIVASPSC